MKSLPVHLLLSIFILFPFNNGICQDKPSKNTLEDDWEILQEDFCSGSIQTTYHISILNEMEFAIYNQNTHVNYYTSDGGITFNSFELPSTFNFGVSAMCQIDNNKFLFCDYFTYSVLSTEDYGLTYDTVITGGNGNYINAINKVNDNTIFIPRRFNTGQGLAFDVYRSFDNGLTWDSTIANGGGLIPWIEAVSDHEIWMAAGNCLFHTTNSGNDWVKVDLPLIESTNTLFHTDFVNSNLGFASSVYQIMKTMDGGLLWSDITPNWLTPAGGIPYVHFINQNEGYIMTRNSFWFTADQGDNWEQISEIDGISYEFSTMKLYNEDFGILIAKEDSLEYDDGLTIFKTTNGGLTYINTIDENKNIQVYPNPVTDILNIPSETSNFKIISITNTLGKKIPYTISGHQINVSNFKNGVYFINMISADRKSKCVKFVKN